VVVMQSLTELRSLLQRLREEDAAR
jgi:hypothetical protein